jgi:sigma-E factor negative regulatory protein RseA
MEKVNSVPNEQVCDLMDGYIQGATFAQDFEAALCDKQAAQVWHTYHVIGDVLRSAELAPKSDDLAFLERLERRLALELPRPLATESVSSDAIAVALPSANAPVFRWKVLAGAASFALLGVVGLNLWTVVGSHDEPQMVAQTITAPPAVATLVADETGDGTMLRDARLDELMAAHRQLGGHSALQVPASFVRNATYEGPTR